MTILSAIVAVANNGVIGNKGTLPWRIPEDMRWFRQNTLGKPIIAGRKTYESFQKKPLPDRTNIVITRDLAWRAEGAVVVHSLDAAIAAAGDAPETVVVGGAEIYALAMPRLTKIYLTNVGLSPEGDAFLPPFAMDEWKQTFVQSHPSLGDKLPGFTFRVLERV
ncbi:MAG: dihydrofolate reductase [Alphaproteobacteria bacterium]|nr:dihydrofolate reductase [Alphaproteobacteria bacterium]